MSTLFKITFLSFILLLLSLFSESNGGLYIYSYLSENDLYKISDLQGSGSSDFVLVVLSSGILFTLFLTTSIIKSIKLETKYILFFFYILLSAYILSLFETSSFLHISYSTISVGKNFTFTAWFMVYIVIIITVVYQILRRIKRLF